MIVSSHKRVNQPSEAKVELCDVGVSARVACRRVAEGAAPSVDEAGTVGEQELRARANMLIDSSNELLDGISEEKSMIGCILQSGQVIIGSRRRGSMARAGWSQDSMENSWNAAKL